MKCRFWLVDLNEGVWEGKPCVRLWGIDEQNQRVVITATEIPPYFYFLRADDLDSTVRRIESDRQRFPNIASVSMEERRLLGKEKKVLRIVCTQPNSVSSYAKQLPKVVGGTSFDDLRLSTRYITDLKLTTCGWNECEVEPVRIEDVVTDQKYVAQSLPRGVSSQVPPDIRFLAFAILEVGQRGSASPQRDPIRALAVASSSGTVSVFTPSGDDDSNLLFSFARVVDDFDPDIIVGYDTNGSHWPYLVQRAKMKKMKLTLGPKRTAHQRFRSFFNIRQSKRGPCRSGFWNRRNQSEGSQESSHAFRRLNRGPVNDAG